MEERIYKMLMIPYFLKHNWQHILGGLKRSISVDDCSRGDARGIELLDEFSSLKLAVRFSQTTWSEHGIQTENQNHPKPQKMKLWFWMLGLHFILLKTCPSGQFKKLFWHILAFFTASMSALKKVSLRTNNPVNLISSYSWTHQIHSSMRMLSIQ